MPGGGSVSPAVRAASMPGSSAALRGDFSFSSMGRGSCTAKASWTSVLLGPVGLVEPRSISALLQGPSAAPGLCLSLSLHARELRGTARGAVGDWGGAGWAEQTNRVWDLYGGVKEPETPWVAQTHLRAGYMQPCSHDQL